VKSSYEQEKYTLESRAERASCELKSLVSLVKSRDCEQDTKQEEMLRWRVESEREIEKMQQEVEEMRKQYEVVRNEKDQADKKVMKLKSSLEKIKNAPKPVKIDLIEKKDEQGTERQLKNLKEEVD